MSEKIKKNLANCTPREFLVQTNKIRKAAAKWLTATDIMNIRRNVPEFPKMAEGASVEDADRAMVEYKQALRDAQYRNLSRIYEEIAGNHPDETLELLALLCFIDPADMDNYKTSELLRNVTEILSDEDILSFFTSLTRLEQIGIFNTAQKSD